MTDPKELLEVPLETDSQSSIRLRILVVEDDEDNLRATLEVLEMLGHWATGVRSAEAAVSRYCEGVFDLLLIDVQLPGLSGIDLALKIREKEQLPVLFVSAAEEFRHLTCAPNVGWLEKPFSVDTLAGSLKKVSAVGTSVEAVTTRQLH